MVTAFHIHGSRQHCHCRLLSLEKFAHGIGEAIGASVGPGLLDIESSLPD